MYLELNLLIKDLTGIQRLIETLVNQLLDQGIVQPSCCTRGIIGGGKWWYMEFVVVDYKDLNKFHIPIVEDLLDERNWEDLNFFSKIDTTNL